MLNYCIQFEIKALLITIWTSQPLAPVLSIQWVPYQWTFKKRDILSYRKTSTTPLQCYQKTSELFMLICANFTKRSTASFVLLCYLLTISASFLVPCTTNSFNMSLACYLPSSSPHRYETHRTFDSLDKTTSHSWIDGSVEHNLCLQSRVQGNIWILDNIFHKHGNCTCLWTGRR